MLSLDTLFFCTLTVLTLTLLLNSCVRNSFFLFFLITSFICTACTIFHIYIPVTHYTWANAQYWCHERGSALTQCLS